MLSGDHRSEKVQRKYSCMSGKYSCRYSDVNLGKIGSNLFEVCRSIFDDNIKNGDFQKVGTTPPIEKALVN